MKNKWTDTLSEEVYNRLASCHSRKEDILPLAKARWLYIALKGYDKEDALVYVLELLDCNGCCFDLTTDEYNDILSCIH